MRPSRHMIPLIPDKGCLSYSALHRASADVSFLLVDLWMGVDEELGRLWLRISAGNGDNGNNYCVALSNASRL